MDPKRKTIAKAAYVYVWLPMKTHWKSLGLVLSHEQQKKMFRDGNIGGGLVMIR
jgi:hypothetical protein